MKYLGKRRFKKFRATESNEENLDNSAKLGQEFKKEKMAEGSKVTIESKEGKLELIAEHSVLLLDNNDIVSIKLPPIANSWTIKCVFTHNINLDKGYISWTIIDKGKGLELKFNRWYSTTWIGNISPYKFSADDGTFEILVKVRTTAVENHNSRAFTINIWHRKLPIK